MRCVCVAVPAPVRPTLLSLHVLQQEAEARWVSGDYKEGHGQRKQKGTDQWRLASGSFFFFARERHHDGRYSFDLLYPSLSLSLTPDPPAT